MGRLTRLRADRRGVTVIEFAVLAPVMITLIAGSIELGYMAMVRSSLEGAVMEAARAVAADLTTDEDSRETRLRQLIERRMSGFPKIDGRPIVIETKVFRDFGSAYPESYEDLNDNGRYDGPVGVELGEPFDDRNRNGIHDVAQQVEGKLGGVGDVVAYTATYPLDLRFTFLGPLIGLDGGYTLRATTMMRNEPAKRRERAS